MSEKIEPFSDIVFHHFLDLLRYKRQSTRQFVNEQSIRQRQFDVLRFLLETGEATVGQVQVYLHKSASTTSELIAQLEEFGYVKRWRSKKDNRVVVVELSSKGREIAQITPLVGLPLLRRRLAKLPEARLKQIDDVLLELIKMMTT
jgi:DNA-binding MarR family transcriptional regulator